MTHRRATCAALWLLIALVSQACLAQESDLASNSQSDQSGAAVSIGNIANIFAAKCLLCHKSDKKEGGYSMADFAAMRQPGDSGLMPIRARAPQESELFQRLTTTDTAQRMPADSPALSNVEIEQVRSWIAAGAIVESSLEVKPLSTLARRSKTAAPKHYTKTVPITALAVEKNGRAVWANGYAEVVRWQLSSSPEHAISPEFSIRLPVLGTQIADLALTDDGQIMAASSGHPGEQGFVQLWSRESNGWQLRWTLNLADMPPDIAFSPDATKLAVGCTDGALIVADCALAGDSNAPRVDRFTPHADAILTVNWSEKGDRLITGSRDRTAKIFQAPKMELIANYDRHERAVGGVAYLGNNPVSFDETGKLRLWTGDDNDRTLAEKDNLPRFLEAVIVVKDQLWLADNAQLRQFTVKHKTVDDGKDADDKPKTKQVVRWEEQDPIQFTESAWILSAGVSDTVVAMGDDQGHIAVWSRESRQTLVRFRAHP